MEKNINISFKQQEKSKKKKKRAILPKNELTVVAPPFDEASLFCPSNVRKACCRAADLMESFGTRRSLDFGTKTGDGRERVEASLFVEPIDESFIVRQIQLSA